VKLMQDHRLLGFLVRGVDRAKFGGFAPNKYFQFPADS
jgi:hypothetical protein